jgi:hypothetical protein
MNPLNMLCGGALMTPAPALRLDDDEVLLDQAGARACGRTARIGQSA